MCCKEDMNVSGLNIYAALICSAEIHVTTELVNYSASNLTPPLQNRDFSYLPIWVPV